MAIADLGLVSDQWLSELLGRPAWKVSTPAALKGGEALKAVGNGFFFTRVPTVEVQELHRLEGLGFRVVDTTITLETADIRHYDVPNVQARFACSSDRLAVAGIASRAFSMSRLHLDPKIPKAIADRSRAAWATNFFMGTRGDAMVIAETDGRIGAFLLALGPTNGVVTIDLMAVEASVRRRGLGAACVRFAATNINGCERLRVGTQVANVASLHFYEALGFRAVSSHYVLHLHRD